VRRRQLLNAGASAGKGNHHLIKLAAVPICPKADAGFPQGLFPDLKLTLFQCGELFDHRV
jgi:hypothetical protein